MLRNLNRTEGGKRILGTPFLGVLGSAVPSSGDSGPAFGYNDLVLPGDATKRFRFLRLTQPSAGTLTINEDSSFTFEGAPAGSYSFTYQKWDDNGATFDLAGSATVTLLVGTPGVAAGVTLSGSSGISGGGASGNGSVGGVAPGSNLSGSSSINAGQAVGLSPGVAPGANLTGNSNLNAGGTQGAINAHADGAQLSGAGSISAGGATVRMSLTTSRRWVIGRRMDPKDPAESITVTFDFSKDATRILGASTFITELYTSSDSNAQLMLDGAPEVHGLKVLQRISGGVSDATYKLRCIVTDEDEERYVRVGELNVVTA